MRPYQVACILVATLLLLEPATIEAKRRKHKGNDHHDSNRSKTKTKWSSSTDLGGSNSQVSTEEHGYYVKRTYSPLTGADGKKKSPPYLAIPIAWFSCESGKTGCQQVSNSGMINSPTHALSEGYLCDDDCMDAYEPICGKTPNEVAVFYNKCKLNVAKCRTHGLWTELPYEQCQQTYPKETTYTDKKFKCSPYFRDASTVVTPLAEVEKDKDSNESSEEQKDSDKKKNKNKNKVEHVEPIALPLQAKPAEDMVPVPVPVPVSVPIETVALPPIPVKTVEPQSHVVDKPTLPQSKPESVKVTEAPKPLESDKDKLKYVVS